MENVIHRKILILNIKYNLDDEIVESRMHFR